MTNKNIYKSLGGLDPELIMKAAPDNKVQKKSNIMARWIVVAACIALIIGAVIALPMLTRNPSDKPMEVTTTPKDNGNSDPPIVQLSYTAKDIAKFFDGQRAAEGTNAYTKVYVSDSKYLLIDELPSDGHLGIYGHGSGMELSEAEFQKFINNSSKFRI